MHEQEITYKQKKWLDDHGGRTIADLILGDPKGLYVLMGNGHGGDMKVYLPKK